MKMLSLVVPCYNEQETIPYYYEEMMRIEPQLPELELEFIFVNDGSRDGTLEQIKKLREKDKRVHYISFSRNFGKESAMYAGLKAVKGDYAVVMDVDLQDPPHLLPEMYKYIKTGEYDCVATRRTTREGEPVIRSFFARKFYKIMNKISDTDIVDGARDYRFMTRKMVDSILSVKEYNRFIKGIYGWVGFTTKWIDFENVERVAGKTKWSFWKLFLYSIEGILAFSTVPLAITSIIGIIFCLIAFILLCFIFIRALCFGDPVAGWPSLVCIVTFLGGVQLMCMGVLGLYLSKTYLEVKERPLYIVKEEE